MHVLQIDYMEKVITALQEVSSQGPFSPFKGSAFRACQACIRRVVHS